MIPHSQAKRAWTDWWLENLEDQELERMTEAAWEILNKGTPMSSLEKGRNKRLIKEWQRRHHILEEKPIKNNNIKITRVAGKESRCTVTLQLEFDAADPKACRRFGEVLRELIPEEEREQFVADFKAAGVAAGFKVEASAG